MIVNSKQKKIIVAMSGGIDSSVAAALLKKQEYDVIGVFMKFWSEDIKNAKNRCCPAEAETKARKVASVLKIPFYVLNFRKEFKKRIVDCFLKEYKAGRTPNPCVICNKQIKFGLLLEKALKLDADFVATGHYARLRREIPNSKSQISNFKLLKGKDKNKDQSYFLWQLNQEQLSRILFPVGNYTKSEVRNMAKKFKLPVLSIPESMEICFIETNIYDFLEKHIKIKPGKIVDKMGDTLGKHKGLWFYTIGQRRKIGLSEGPYFVLGKNLKKNLLVVSKSKKDVYQKELIAKDINWISGKTPKLPQKVAAKTRYQHSPDPAIITSADKNKLKLAFEKPQRAITPGQSVVFYKYQELIGGGIID